MKLRKLLSLLAAVVMLLGMMPTAFADDADHEHNWVWGWLPKAPAKNCLEYDTYAHYCTICGTADHSEDVPGPCAGSGKWVWNGKVPANCQIWGVKIELCKYCGGPTASRDVLGDHTWKTDVRKPTCTKEGSERTYCSTCQTLKEEIITKPRGHNYHNFVLIQAPTCTEFGRKSGECTRCDGTVTYNVKTIPHIWTEWEIIREATAKQEGIREKHCTMCGETEKDRFRVGKENEPANSVISSFTVEVTSALPQHAAAGDSFVVELKVTNTGDTILSYADAELNSSDKPGTPAADENVDISMLNPGESFIVPVTVSVTGDDQTTGSVKRTFTVNMNVWANEKVGYMTPDNKDVENDVSYAVDVDLTGSADIVIAMQ